MALISKITAIADAVRAKTGGSTLLTLDQMADAISGLSDRAESVVSRTISGEQAFTSSSIGLYAFAGCTALTDVALPNATDIGNGAFYGCSALETVDIPNVTYISASAFQQCGALQEINARNVNFVGGSAFASANLQDIDLAEAFPSLRQVDNNAFSFAYRATDVKMPNVLYVGTNGFANAKSGLTVSLMGVETIGGGAFAPANSTQPVGSCVLLGPNLRNITCGSSDTPPFKNIELAIILAETPPTLTGPYLVVSTNGGAVTGSSMSSVAAPPREGWPTQCETPAKIYVPDDSLAAYKSATNWSVFMNRVGHGLSELPNYVVDVFPEVQDYL